MKNVSDLYKAVIASNFYYVAWLFTFTLADGTTLLYTTADIDLIYNGNIYRCGGLEGAGLSRLTLFKLPKLTFQIGLQVDVMQLEIYPPESDFVDGIPILHALRRGYFDNADVRAEVACMPSYGDLSPGTCVMFRGQVGDVDPAGITKATIRVNNYTALLNIQMPRNLFGPGCHYNLFGPGCGVSRSAFRTAATVGAGPTLSSIPVPGTGQPDSWFDLGTITVGSQLRTIKKWANNVATVFVPLYGLPNAGDPVVMYPGCDRLETTCDVKFSNKANFGGEPFVPIPETSL